MKVGIFIKGKKIAESELTTETETGKVSENWYNGSRFVSTFINQHGQHFECQGIVDKCKLLEQPNKEDNKEV